MALCLSGAPVAEKLDVETAQRVLALKVRGVTPTLGILRVGEKADSLAYEKSAVKRCEKVGIAVHHGVIPKNAGQDEVFSFLNALNRVQGIHGILILSPLPEQMDTAAVYAALDPKKDVDGVTDTSLSGVFTGGGHGFTPCTAQACLEILDFYGIECGGKRAVVLGRSLVVGKPVSMLLLDRDATVTLCHTKTADAGALCREADIVIAAAGKMEAFTGDYFSPGQTVLDVGIHWDAAAGRLRGDVKADEAGSIVAALSPVPGGVGSVTTSVLARHVVRAAENSAL